MCAPGFVIFATLCVLCNSLPGGRGGQSVEIMKVLSYKPGGEAGFAVNGTIYSHKMWHADYFKSVRLPWNTKSQVNSFKWQNCGGASDLLVVNGLTVTPDPLRVPGTVRLKFDVTIQETFTSPLKLVLEVKKHEGFIWLPIPCIDDMGSCTFDDVCQKLAGITCPKEFGDQIPCKCPFTKGSYSLPSSTFSVPVHVPSGKYFIQANLSTGSQAVNCIKIYFDIA
ncbi:hypothetical protein BsWGS_18006 [Bradybaena similaris]